MTSELGRVIEQVEKDKGIDKAILVEALESAMLMAAKKRFGAEKEIEAHFNEDLGEIELFQFKTVVEKVTDGDMQIGHQPALELDPDVNLGDSIGVKLDSSEFGRIAAQTAKQVIIQKVRDAERDIIYREFNVRKGEVVSGTCRRIEKGCLIVDLGRTDAILPAREQIPGEHYRPGDRVLGFLIDVQQTPRGPKIVLSRTCPELLMQLFKQEVPEVAEGIVQIKGAAREPGVRAKIAVISTDSDVDPVGACVGVKGARVQAVVQELRGEKIDIVPWDGEDTRFVCNALAPAEVSKVLLDEQNRSMEIIVADNQLSLAIGKRGQNVKLASMLTGWRLDIVSETKMARRSDDAKRLLMNVEGINDTLAQAIYHYGFTVEMLPKADLPELINVPGMTEEKAKEIQPKAAEFLASETYATMKRAMQDAEKALSQQHKMSTDAVFERLKAEVRAHQEREQRQVTDDATAAAAAAAAAATPSGDSSGGTGSSPAPTGSTGNVAG